MGGLLSSLLSSLGFMDRNMNIIVTGLDNAGKTTLIHQVKGDKFSMYPPTYVCSHLSHVKHSRFTRNSF